jgi:hypothetical protein
MPIYSGTDPGGGRAPHLKLEKIWFFWCKIVIFHTKYPKIFAPPSARRNFFKCAPLFWNPGSASENNNNYAMFLARENKKSKTYLQLISFMQMTKLGPLYVMGTYQENENQHKLSYVWKPHTNFKFHISYAVYPTITLSLRCCSAWFTGEKSASHMIE